MAASFYESLEEKSSRLFFLLGDGCWMLGVDEVLEGLKLQYYIGLIALIRLIGLIGLIGLIRLIGLIWLIAVKG